MELVHQEDTKKTTSTANLNNTSSLKCLYTNADTLTNKMPELKALIEEHFLSIRIVSEWNSLPSKIVESPNLKIFKRRLDQYSIQHDLKYNFRGSVNCSPNANQGIRTSKTDTMEEGAADDLDI